MRCFARGMGDSPDDVEGMMSQTRSAQGNLMIATDSIFQRAVSNLLTEVFDGPPGQEAYLLNPGDPGLLRQLDTIDASAASKRPMPGRRRSPRTSITCISASPS